MALLATVLAQEQEVHACRCSPRPGPAQGGQGPGSGGVSGEASRVTLGLKVVHREADRPSTKNPMGLDLILPHEVGDVLPHILEG